MTMDCLKHLPKPAGVVLAVTSGVQEAEARGPL